MKCTLIALLLLTSISSFGAMLVKSDYKKIKAIVQNESSAVLLKKGYILEELDPRAFDQIKITTDILDINNSVTVNATILPSEENCRCQDIFEVSMEVVKNKKIWSITSNTVNAKHIATDQ
jgi:hypothetical protein